MINTRCWDNYKSAFNRDAVFITIADQGIYNKITNTLIASGIFENSMNVQVRGGHCDTVKVTN